MILHLEYLDLPEPSAGGRSVEYLFPRRGKVSRNGEHKAAEALGILRFEGRLEEIAEVFKAEMALDEI